MSTDTESQTDADSTDSRLDRLPTIYPQTAIAVFLAPFYGIVAFPAVIEVALLSNPEYLPLRLGAVLGLLVPVAFRCWRSRAHANRSNVFVLIATPLTFALLFVMFDPFPPVRGTPVAAVEVVLASAGAAALALAVTWYVTDDPT